MRRVNWIQDTVIEISCSGPTPTWPSWWGRAWPPPRRRAARRRPESSGMPESRTMSWPPSGRWTGPWRA